MMLEIKDSERDYKKLTPVAYLIIVSIIVFVVGIWYYFGVDFLQKKKVENKVVSNVSDIKELTLDEQLVELNKRSRIDIPQILSEKEVSSKNLPTVILTLFGSEAIYNKVKSVTYDTKYSGFEIELSYPKAVRDAYFSVLNSLKTEKWTNLYGSRYEDSGILDIENKIYKARVEFSRMNETNTDVRVFVINKKI